MPFTMFNVPLLNPQQTSPFGNLIQGALQNYQQGIQARYANPMAQQQLQAAQLQNKYNPQIWQSEIGLRGAEGSELSSEAVLNRFKQQNPEYMDVLASIYRSQLGQGQPQGQQQQPQPQGQPSPYPSSQQNNMGVAQPSGGMNNPPNMSSDNTGIANDAVGSATGDYGLPAPSLSAGATNPLISKLVGVSPTDTAKMNTHYAQVQDQYNRYAEESTEANKAAIAANNMKQSLAVFNNATDNTDLSGSLLGHLPAVTTEAQESDLASAKALPESIHAVKEAMGSARFSNLDLQQADKLNFTRTMNKGTRKLYTDWVNLAADRIMEYPQLINWAKNPANGMRIEDTKRAWQLYQQQNPIISKDGKSVNNNPKYPLSDYLTPQALASIKNTGTYNPDKNTISNTEAVSDKFRSPSKTIGNTKYIKGPDGDWYY